jgi:ribosomal protein S18 acetylase RimI-like enzyme
MDPVNTNFRGGVDGRLFREWTLGDLPSVRNVTWLTWLDAYAPFIPVEDLRAYFDEHYSLESLEQLFHAPSVKGYVAIVNGEVVGYLKTMFAQRDKRFYISSVYILPGFQGAGLGGNLMKKAEDQALHCGVNEVWLGVMTQNIPALEWYRRNGFVFVEEQPFAMGRTTVPHLIGYKKIQQPLSTISLQ